MDLLPTYFSTENGVQQGGVLSPILFGICIDELLHRLSQSSYMYGCTIGHLYFGSFGIADYVSFVAPYIHALNKVCDIALEYASEYDIKCNPSKCQLINLSNNKNVTFQFNNVSLNTEEKGSHLCSIIGPYVSHYVFKMLLLPLYYISFIRIQHTHMIHVHLIQYNIIQL